MLKMMTTITKRFGEYPFAHRQPKHEGHCRFIHGHNWQFEITLSAKTLDECGFVYDFGQFAWFKEWLTHQFDHTTVLNADDPALGDLWYQKALHQLRTVPDCSCEGLAALVFEYLQSELTVRTAGRVSVVAVTVLEDLKNSATHHYAG